MTPAKKKPKNSKARITITLRQELLPLLDRFIDGEQIRNRSHAIEFILGQNLGSGISHAVILATGAPKTAQVHAMTRIKNRPAIEYWFEELKNSGIRDVFVVVDKFGSELKKHVGDGSQWGVHVTFIKDTEKKGTGHALSLVEPLIDSTFIVLYGDVLADIHLTDIVDAHRQSNTLATVALTYIRSAGNYGVARLEGSSVAEFSEKPGRRAKHGLVNAGVYVFEPDIFNIVNQETTALEKDALPTLAQAGQLTGYPFQGQWFDISNATGLRIAEKEWRQ